MKLGILGDYYATPRSAEPPIVGERMQTRLKAADHVVVNFEGPVARADDPAAFKTGPSIRQHPAALPALASNGVCNIAIANNHGWDYGRAGLQQTIEKAARLGIGACGLAIDGLAQPLDLSQDGLRVSLLAFTEREWCGPAGASPAIAVIDPIFMARSLARARSACDAVVVLLHANNEYHHLPSESLVKNAEFLIEQGACAVLVHHAHVTSGMRRHHGRPIFYGLGNFQVTLPSTSPDFYEGLYVELTIDRNADGAVSVAHQVEPIVMNPANYAVDLATDEAADAIMREFDSLSLLLESPAALEASYAEFLDRSKPMYREMLNPWGGGGRWARLAGRLGVKSWLRKPRNRAFLLNAMRCESHRQALISLLSEGVE